MYFIGSFIYTKTYKHGIHTQHTHIHTLQLQLLPASSKYSTSNIQPNPVTPMRGTFIGKNNDKNSTDTLNISNDKMYSTYAIIMEYLIPSRCALE